MEFSDFSSRVLKKKVNKVTWNGNIKLKINLNDILYLKANHILLKLQEK